MKHVSCSMFHRYAPRIKHFWIYCVFLAPSRPKVILFCWFCILMFTFFAGFKDGGHWLHLDTEVTYLGLV